MLPLGMVLVFGAYGVGSWGWLLVKGENITLREWFSPLSPFTGPLDGNGKVPQGSIFPTGKKGSGAGTGTVGQTAGGLTPGNAAQVGQDIGGFLSGFAP